VDYDAILGDARAVAVATIIDFLREELPFHWRDEYHLMTSHEHEIVVVNQGTFTYYYDSHSGQPGILAPSAELVEARLVGVVGVSAPPNRRREASRMRGWIGQTGTFSGTDRDKGHFIGHSLGGIVDGFEMNLFSQSRIINRGRSASGGIYRRMERYCARHPGTFCFSRPIYLNQSSKPARLEFGLLHSDNTLWVEMFEN